MGCMEMRKGNGSLLGYHHLNILQNVHLLGWSVCSGPLFLVIVFLGH